MKVHGIIDIDEARNIRIPQLYIYYVENFGKFLIVFYSFRFQLRTSEFLWFRFKYFHLHLNPANYFILLNSVLCPKLIFLNKLFFFN